MDTKKMRDFVDKELKKIIQKMFPYKNKNEVEYLLETWTEEFIQKCINISVSENKDLRKLIFETFKNIDKELAKITNNKFFTFNLISDAILRTASDNLISELDKEVENALDSIISRLLYLNEATNYVFNNGYLGGTLIKMGGVRVIVDRVVKGGVTNVFNNYELSRFKEEFKIIYKNLKKAKSKGLDVEVFRIDGKFGKNGITSKIVTPELIKKIEQKKEDLRLEK